MHGRRAALLLLPLLAACPGAPPPGGGAGARGPLPPDSLYHLEAAWTDQQGEARRLADLRGHVVVVTMMFTRCEYACPMIVADLKAIEAGLPAGGREEARFLLASFDADHDDAAVLREYARAMELPAPRWTLLHGLRSQVRELAAALGISYEPTAAGFAHSNLIVVLDRDGVPRHRQEGLGADPAPTVAAILRVARDAP